MDAAARAELKSRLGLFDEDDVLTLRQLESKQTLRNERNRGDGPPWVRVGFTVFYPISKFKAYIAKRTIVPKKSATLIDSDKKRAEQRRQNRLARMPAQRAAMAVARAAKKAAKASEAAVSSG